MGLHHRDYFGMIPLDSFDGIGGIHAHASTNFGGPKHWHDAPAAPSPKAVKGVREVDLSVMMYRTPLLYAQIHGEYVKFDEEIDEAAHQWEVVDEEYQRDVIPLMPDWVMDYLGKIPWLHKAKIIPLTGVEEDVENPNLETISFRVEPLPIHKAKPHCLSFKSVWVNHRTVLPKNLRTTEDEAVFLYDEFVYDKVATDAEEISYHFFLSDGTEYSIEGLYGIEWHEIGEKVVVDNSGLSAQAEVNRVIGETLKDKHPMAEPLEVPKKKPTRGKGKHGVKLFTAVFRLDEFLYVEQYKSKDWETAWGDFREKISTGNYDSGIDGKNLEWYEVVPFSRETRNAFVGTFKVDGKDVDVTIVNTKRGKEPGVEKFADTKAYIET